MPNPTIKEALKSASSLLEKVTNIPQKEAKILLSHHLKKENLYLLLHENEKVENYQNFLMLIDKRINHKPIEYITNNVSFYSREWFIKEGALIPRPETEILIDKAVEIAKTLTGKIEIAEIGTGSGIISIMLALLLPNANITASDISEEALKIAKINAKKHNVEDQIIFFHTPYLENIQKDFDIIVSNPPYIANDYQVEKHLLQEPDIALFGGEKGDEILKKIIDITLRKKVKYLVCEMGYDQQESLSSYLKEKGVKNYAFYKDLSSFDRGFIMKPNL